MRAFPAPPGVGATARQLMLGCLILAVFAFSQKAVAAPPPSVETISALREQTAALGRKIDELRKSGKPAAAICDVEICRKAAEWIVKHDEWFPAEKADYAQWTKEALALGNERTVELAAGKMPWLQGEGKSLRAYRSIVDGSVQPYALVMPKGYPGGERKAWRLDVILHGRDGTLNEVKFIHQHGKRGAAPDQAYLELHVYGRTNNAYRWAGEEDVWEALAEVRSRETILHGRNTIDPQRIVLRGFSMGGAGAWHLGLHHPGRWCSVSPGAGFSTTYGPVKNKDGKLAAYLEKSLSHYESLDYAENVFNTPFVAYGGADDPQLEAARSIEAKVRPLNLPLTLLIGPGTKHAYHPDSLKEIMRLQAEHAAAGRPIFPPRVQFVTFTPRFGECDWVRVWVQDRPLERSEVKAEFREGAANITTQNVRVLSLGLHGAPAKSEAIPLAIDGEKLEYRRTAKGTGADDDAYLLREGAAWKLVAPDAALPTAAPAKVKYGRVCGPIDDAFTGPFLCVRGTGRAWNAAVDRYAQDDLARFAREWSKYLRGELPIKNDTDVTPQDLAEKNLILFGDPGSNALIAKVLPGLPLAWTREKLEMNGQSYPAEWCLPAMIRPSPFQAERYIVINSGHTFHQKEFEDTNRMLYPRLGDYAVLRVSGDGSATKDKSPAAQALAVEVVQAGLFDSDWKFGK